jgi:hypothetical protein
MLIGIPADIDNLEDFHDPSEDDHEQITLISMGSIEITPLPLTPAWKKNFMILVSF